MIGLIGAAVLLGFPVVTDIRTKKVPVWWIVVVGLTAIPVHLIFKSLSILEMALGLLTGIVALAIAYFTKEKIGYGDGLMVAAAGLWTGGSVIVAATVVASLSAGIFGLFLMLIRKKRRDHQIPFAPFLFGAVLFVGILRLVFEKGTG